VATPTLPSHDPNAFSTIRNALDNIQSKKKYVTKYIYEIEKKTPKEHIVGKLCHFQQDQYQQDKNM